MEASESRYDAQVVYPAGSLDKIVADACGFLWDLMLPTARRTPQHLSFRGVELESIAAHPLCDVVHTCCASEAVRTSETTGNMAVAVE